MDYIQIIELIAALLGILYLILEVKASMWLWRVGVILPLFYIFLSWQSKVYGNIVVNLYYLITSIWGWWLWSHRARHGSVEGGLAHEEPSEGIRLLRDLTGRVHCRTTLGVLMVCLLLPVALWPLFLFITDSPQPLMDSIATSMGFVGMWLLAKKYVENWFCFIISNALYALLYFLQGYRITALFFVVYTILAVVGLVRWLRLYRRGQIHQKR